MTETIATVTIIAAINLFVVGYKMHAELRREKFEKDLRDQFRRLANEMREAESTETAQNESLASESVKKVTADPDFNPHPYSAKYERFSDNELDEAREYLTTKQRKSIGG